MRKFSFADGEFYHVYNRGVDRRDTFLDAQDFNRFLASMISFNSVKATDGIYAISLLSQSEREELLSREKLVDIVAYCLNTNHYHLLLKQVSEGGLSEFMQRVGSGYTTYFNKKNKRTGSLFGGTFKAVHVDSEGYLLNVSAYINLNNRVHQIQEGKYRSSWNEYMTETPSNQGLCKPNDILSEFQNRQEYKTFAESSVDFTKRRRADIEKDLIAFSLEHSEVELGG